ncbi:autotransporter outer membrane beta-barrel domain-containing protein [Pseudomonas poae]|nr:autotransporter outer membrane beta-barrel domain-containing protein [Pseudomonas poae]
MASGNHTLIVADSGHEPSAADGRLLLVDTNGGSAKFDLYGGHVDAGAFRYGLQQEGDDWVLASTGKSSAAERLSSGGQCGYRGTDRQRDAVECADECAGQTPGRVAHGQG